MRRSAAPAVLLAAALVAVLLLPIVAGDARTSFAVTPAAGRGARSLSVAGLTPAVQPIPAASSTPSAGPSCPTPASNGIWGSTDQNGQVDFFKSVKVSFYVPGDPQLSGSNFNTTPCTNTVPTYLDGFWLNISTDVQIASAVIEIWGLGWSLPNQAFATPIPGFSPGEPYSDKTPTNVSMYVNPPLYTTASFYFDDYKNFWPGSIVYFNLNVTALNASPAIISSVTSSTPDDPVGTNDPATWEFGVASPWTSNNFTEDVAVSTIPNIFGTPGYDPNPDQPLQIVLTAINVGTGTTLSIPEAQLAITVCPAPCTATSARSLYGAYFGPDNHSTETLVNVQSGAPITIGPFPAGSNITFNVSAFVPWEGGIIDRIYSPLYNFTWSKKGGWWEPNEPLEDNLELTTNPGPLGPVPLSYAPMTPVNVTIHEPIQNVTIGSAVVNFQYHDLFGTVSGSVPMIPEGLNTSYLVIPGLPNGGNMTFSVLAKDIHGDTVASDNYSYYETGSLAVPPPPSTGYLFFEAVDLSTGLLYAHVPFTISNSTWSESGNITPWGFGGVLPPAGLGFLPISYGEYTLTITANGISRSAAVTVSSALTKPTIFYFVSQPVTTINTVQAETFPIAAAIGIVAAAIVAVPVFGWFTERRRKAEAEQKRITL